jgi:antitoxin (DNA-binding transcriptional repressor) of toxin-antitoxin stability system
MVSDLCERTDELVRAAEAGHLSIVAKHGRPLFVAVPLDESLLREGVAVALALCLYAEKAVSLGKAARLAGFSVEEFITRLGVIGIPAVALRQGSIDRIEQMVRERPRRSGALVRALYWLPLDEAQPYVSRLAASETRIAPQRHRGTGCSSHRSSRPHWMSALNRALQRSPQFRE